MNPLTLRSCLPYPSGADRRDTFRVCLCEHRREAEAARKGQMAFQYRGLRVPPLSARAAEKCRKTVRFCAKHVRLVSYKPSNGVFNYGTIQTMRGGAGWRSRSELGESVRSIYVSRVLARENIRENISLDTFRQTTTSIKRLRKPDRSKH